MNEHGSVHGIICCSEHPAAARGVRDRTSKQLHRQVQSHAPGFLIVRGVRKNISKEDSISIRGRKCPLGSLKK